MKTTINLLVIILIVSIKTWAGSISGEISYLGGAKDSIFVAAFLTPDLDGEPIQITSLSEPGNYVLENLDDGTYYVVSVITSSTEYIKATDPYGFWGTSDSLTAVIILGNSNVTGINLTLIDGTEENPNPFAEKYIEPSAILQLTELTEAGKNPCIAYDGTSILLYKHDYQDAPSAKVYIINPETGEIKNTIYLNLESAPNRISWIEEMTFRNEELWAVGGFGDPSGTGYVNGVFKIDLNTSNSSSQIKFNSLIENTNGIACDGTNFFVGVKNNLGEEGIVKFNPDQVSEIQPDLFIDLQSENVEHITYGDGILWVGIDKVNKFDPVNGAYLGNLELPASSSELYIDNNFWTYDEVENCLFVYNLSTVGIKEQIYPSYSYNKLSQNYPNPFNPTSIINYTIKEIGNVNINIYDVLGRKVKELLNEIKTPGSYKVKFDGSNLASGIYIYTMQVNNFFESKKMILTK
ncbi:MAG: T9SS type A sorting domain-containing protein [Ignavibacteriae bacterium]|nr:T9SS type A sorting domain-containing protein [Ignavibacteriota bacterium]